VRPERSLLRFLMCGSLDGGTSTLIAQLLYESNLLFKDRLACLPANPADEVDFASFVDGLEAEGKQGITVDVSYRFFATPKRRFIVADSPGHGGDTRNLVAGGAAAELAVLLMDARKGFVAQTRRHLRIAALLGIRQVVLAVNKMDLIDFDDKRFQEIVTEYEGTARQFGFEQLAAVPISAKLGDNVVRESERIRWYKGATLLQILETFTARETNGPARFQARCNPDQNLREVAGTQVSACFRPGDSIRVARSRRTARISRIVTFEGEQALALPGDAITLTLDSEVDISRGDILSSTEDPPTVAD
jgi:bifunctional enzyme CysN/CysC